MATYNFDTITAAEALAIREGDIVHFNGPPANTINVLYVANGFVVTYAGYTIEFGPALGPISRSGGLKFADGSEIYIDDGEANRVSLSTWDATALFGGDGADTLSGGYGGSFVHGNAGDDWITGWPSGGDALYGGKGDDYIAVATGGAGRGSFLHGNMGADSLFGGAHTDTLLGGQDNDQIVGNGGADYINGNLGDDDISAGFLGGWIYGEAGADTIFGGTGGENHIFGGDGDDVIHGRGPGQIDGGAGDDDIDVRSYVRQVADGGAGNDYLLSNDQTPGREGHHLLGGAGYDMLMSIHGGDTLWGGTENDTFIGSNGKTVMFGEAGQDFFRLVPKDVSSEANVEEVRDWSSEDYLSFTLDRYERPIPAPRSAYLETTAADYGSALTTANGAMQNGSDVVAVGVVRNVMVFADINGDNQADAAVILTGVGLDVISSANLV